MFVVPFSAIPSQLESSAILNHGTWAEILESWITQSNNSRSARVIKMGDKAVTIKAQVSTANKRDVSETDLYLLGMIYKTSYMKLNRPFVYNSFIIYNVIYIN